ncbi:YbdD/YjiX family protein [Fictibacillus nanhaiensis]|uniref:YbdD/YjiX family protein n=1 Tax=Fictibacillus nanhaiensis TaxID=742169 RepID=UPI003C17C815
MTFQAAWNWVKDIFQILLYIGKGISNLPDYQAYVKHLKENHPDRTPPTEKEFFAELLENKYGANAKRC